MSTNLDGWKVRAFLAEDNLKKCTKRAIIAEEQLVISKKLYAQKCDAHMALEAEVMRLKRMLGPHTTTDKTTPVYGHRGIYGL